jgi:hypothetical protein
VSDVKLLDTKPGKEDEIRTWKNTFRRDMEKDIRILGKRPDGNSVYHLKNESGWLTMVDLARKMMGCEGKCWDDMNFPTEWKVIKPMFSCSKPPLS